MKQIDKAFMIAETLFYRSDYGKQLLTMTDIETCIGQIAGTDNRSLSTYRNLLIAEGFVISDKNDKYRVPEPKKPLTPTEIRDRALFEAKKRKQAKTEE